MTLSTWLIFFESASETRFFSLALLTLFHGNAGMTIWIGVFRHTCCLTRSEKIARAGQSPTSESEDAVSCRPYRVNKSRTSQATCSMSLSLEVPGAPPRSDALDIANLVSCRNEGLKYDRIWASIDVTQISGAWSHSPVEGPPANGSMTLEAVLRTRRRGDPICAAT